MVCHLKRTLYGLRQAPRAWHTRLKEKLGNLEFVASFADAALFSGVVDGERVYLIVWVDDILVAARGAERIAKVKAHLAEKFDVRDLGEATLAGARARSVPLGAGEKLAREGKPLDTAKFPYSELIGSLLYLSVCTRPDIAQAVGALARCTSAPTEAHRTAALRVVRYLAGTAEAGITFGGSGEVLEAFCDADYARDVDTRRSTTGYVFLMYRRAVSWSSRLQPTVAASTVESEYMSAGQAVKEALWFRKLGGDLGLNLRRVKIYCDNQGAPRLLKHPIASQRPKHIDVIHHFAREGSAEGDRVRILQD
ncbi:hypothetical protein KFL_012360010 [Klebsormidium nitens]|uniref:Reverse transcriptase Ty1/copia-type domain-containing protein n=1 Tax=Klebsormidium nitens TaxID=105231 RepID=A0A1Y1IVS2_KLENI|nr:hypothetical protein KFL_012360010 [Klebsormidium nitens]|eukprot:GAQ92986.1 hypothetical protein KFL_012360010 [Klebsormidium nitens]